MTSTNFSVGIASEKLTSRVLKPPGGGHTNIFGPAEPEVPKRNKRFESSIVLGGDNTPKKADNEEVIKAENGNNEATEEVTVSVDENSGENGVQNGQEETKEVQPEPVKPAPQEPPRRVRVPPGGFSSGLW